jgi:hypothetical protein
MAEVNGRVQLKKGGGGRPKKGEGIFVTIILNFVTSQSTIPYITPYCCNSFVF